MNRVEQIYVILPTFNNEKTIQRAIESVINQDYDGYLSLIVVANGCTDNTVNVANQSKFAYYASEKKSYKRRFEIEVSEQKGVVASFNKGLEVASYMHTWADETMLLPDKTWICRMDADDLWHPNKLSKQIEFLNANPDIDILGTQMNLCHYGEYGYDFHGATRNPCDHDTIVRFMLNGSNVIANPSAIYKWDVMTKAGRLEDIFPYAEDYWFWMKALITGHKFANLPLALMDYDEGPIHTEEGMRAHLNKPHSNPEIGQSVAQVGNFILHYNQKLPT